MIKHKVDKKMETLYFALAEYSFSERVEIISTVKPAIEFDLVMTLSYKLIDIKTCIKKSSKFYCVPVKSIQHTIIIFLA